MSDYTTVRVGDENPSPMGERCEQHAPSPHGYVCTRHQGHTGQHVAEGTTHVQYVWTDTALTFMGVDITDDMVIAFVRHYRRLQQAGRL